MKIKEKKNHKRYFYKFLKIMNNMETQKLNNSNWINLNAIEATKKELEMIKEADESGFCNEKEKAEIDTILNNY